MLHDETCLALRQVIGSSKCPVVECRVVVDAVNKRALSYQFGRFRFALWNGTAISLDSTTALAE